MSILEEAGAGGRAGAGWRLRGLGARPEGLCVSLRCPQRARLSPRRKKGHLRVRRVSQIQTTYICDRSSRHGAMSKADPLRGAKRTESLKPGVEQGRLVSGTSLVVQRLRIHAPNAGGLGSIPGQGTDPICGNKGPTCKLRPQCSQINK